MRVADYVVGISVATLIGYLCQLVPVVPVVQSVVATLVGALVAFGIGCHALLERIAEESGAVALSVGLAESLGAVLGVLLLSLAGHWGLAWLEQSLRVPSVVAYRPTILALLGALAATIPLWSLSLKSGSLRI